MSITGPQRWPLYTTVQTHRRFVTLKNLRCSMAISAYHRSNFAALPRYWWLVYLQILSRTKYHKEANKQKNCRFLLLPLSYVDLLMWVWREFPVSLCLPPCAPYATTWLQLFSSKHLRSSLFPTDDFSIIVLLIIILIILFFLLNAFLETLISISFPHGLC